MKKIVLITGASGFIGSQIARYLLEDKEVTIIAVVRANNDKEAPRKLAREWYYWPELTDALGSRIEVVHGDVSLSYLGLTEATYNDISERITHIIHAAADWRFISLDELRKTNVQGTANVIDLAKKAHQHHGLERFSHISTAYVAGAKTGSIPEDNLTDEFGFFTEYERSKYEGELLVQALKTELPVSVFRPSMVVGDSKTGAIKTFNTFYFPLRLYLIGKIRILPVSKSLRINMVPVDYVAKSVVNLTFDHRAKGKNFHLVAPYELLPTISNLLDYVRDWAKNNLHTKLTKAFCVSMSTSSMETVLKIQRLFQKKNHKTTDALISLAPYFSEKRQFERSNVDKLLGSYDMKWQEILPKLLDYAVYYGFFHRSERTVQEQVLFRLGSKSHPITYFDLVEEQVIHRTAADVRQEILAATSALRAMGITSGDRVALTGLNSSIYFSADVAIGLVGAVSVPLYYTTPPADIDTVLKASQAKLFLIGMPSLLQRVEELTTDIPMVSFCRGSFTPDKAKKVISWQEFLSKTTNQNPSPTTSVFFEDIATLRYSSGTTGKPKGAIFKHHNLRYMAESIVSITPWRARNRKTTYLSFLPMGHVVEGILAAYSPYYYPAAIDIYFLEDFRKLSKALPKVRPTIFFSVPRVYEKVWEGLENNKLGKLYVKRKKGLIKWVLKPIIKSITLKKAGLNKCVQLIAGSASSDEDLLKNYRELGVEIHNAYGMTEAPLITINRVGHNELGTVGEPMPMTQVKIAEDGEIMVRGPQVTTGYFDNSIPSPFKDGWLMTGDIGHLTPEGSLVILGRKKELIKTSYGKCIYSGKIENLLREVPGVSEAMLVGESKPYCAALLWIQKEQLNEKTTKTIDDAIEELNKRLSNPEKVKKWALLKNTLSIENGDLTPNLKLKHNVMAQRYAKVIDALYGNSQPEAEIHIGGAEKPE